LRPRRTSERLPPSFGLGRTGKMQGLKPCSRFPAKPPLRLHPQSRRRAGLQARLAPDSHAPRSRTMTDQVQIIPQDGDVIDVPLNKLKASPRNARRTPHAEADIEALAA